MKFITLIVALALFTYWFTGGDYGTDQIFGPPDTLPLYRYEEMSVSVYFYFPNGNEVYLGDTIGASSCGDYAYSYAYEKDLSRYDDWSYVCCTHEAESDCYRKIR